MNDLVIYKYKVDTGRGEYVLPIGASVVHFGQDPKDGELYAWVMHAVPDTGRSSALYRFQIHPTGIGFDPEVWTYSRTAILPNGLVWHLLVGTSPQFGKMDQIDRSTFYATNRTSQ